MPEPLAADLEAVLWDMNGVLLDDEWHLWEAFKRVTAARGVITPDEEFSRYCGVTERECFAIALSLPVDSEEVGRCQAERRARYREILGDALPIFPGAKEALDRAAKAGLKQAIASGSPRDEVMRVAAALGAERFGAIVAAEDVSKGKPDPEGYLLAARRLGVSPANCLVIEDSVHGVEAALSAGMAAVALATNLPPERLGHARRVYPDLLTALDAGELGF